MDSKNLCMGCMSDKGVDSRCHHCGWVEGTPQSLPQHLPARTLLKNRYLLGRVLGHGGFGVTYLAWDTIANIRLAIKEYLPQDLATRASGQSQVKAYNTGELQGYFQYGLKRFLDEARTLAQFTDHTGIVSFKDFFEDNGTAYLVMQHLDGITFKHFIQKRGGRIPVEMAIDILMPVMDALREVHSVGLLHRDVSPDNILICKNGQIKVLDFGAARYSFNERSQSLSVMLKAGYTPLEQYSSKGIQGPWTDVYATAATLYHAIIGQTPPEALDRIYDDTLVFPEEINLKVQRLLIKALAVKPEQRFQSVKELQDNLLAIYPKNEPQSERPVKETPLALLREVKVNNDEQHEANIEDTVAVHASKEVSSSKADRKERQSYFKRNGKLSSAVLCLFVILLGVGVFYLNNTPKNNNVQKVENNNNVSQPAQKETQPEDNASVNQQVQASQPETEGSAAKVMNQINTQPAKQTVNSNKTENVTTPVTPLTEPVVVPPIATANFKQGGWYEGDIKNGQPNGRGTYHNPDGSTIVGRWENGQYIGP